MSYTLMISEKPAAAKKIAKSLCDENTFYEERKKNKSVYYTFTISGEEYVVVPAVGHLYGLKIEDKKGWHYPVFNPEWHPIFEINKKSYYAKKYYENFEKLYKNADNFIVCTDWDNEGSVIAYNILRFICKTKKAERMRFTTLTEEEIRESFNHRLRNIDMGEVNAGLARHHLDWMYGVNITRALTLSLKKVRKGFRIISTGRVQGPALKILCDKEKKIRNFVPEDYWTIKLLWNDFSLDYKKKRIFDKKVAEKIISECKEEVECFVKKVNKKKGKINPPVPFNLTGLQSEAYRRLGYNPRITQSIAQKLYVKALISYPRTSSQKLPEKIDYRKILNKLKKQEEYKKFGEELVKKKILKPRQGKKKDRAHTAIYPTGEVPKKLTKSQKKVYDLIVKRFMSVFGKPAVKETTRIVLNIGEHDFRTSGYKILKNNWINYYKPYANYEQTIFPEIKEGEKISDYEIRMNKDETKPPGRYSYAGIIKKMEKLELGTKSTRANIVEKLKKRNYIKGKKSIRVTDYGLKVIETLEKHCPRIINKELTRKFEKQMRMIIDKKEIKEEVISQAQEIIMDISRDFKDNEEEIGKDLNKGLEKMWDNNSSVGEYVGKCDKCGNKMVVMYSKKYKSEFIGCTDYPECKNSYPLPHKDFEAVDKLCKECGAPIIKINDKEICVNNKCESRIKSDCDKCDGKMVLRISKKKQFFLGCNNFPKCKNIKKV